MVKGVKKRVRSYEMSPELAYILGVLLGDGYIKKVNGEECAIGLNCIDKDFADYFAYVLEKWSGYKPSRWEREYYAKPPFAKRKYRFKLYYVVLYGKELVKVVEWHMEKLKDYVKIKEYAKMFLKGFFDSEGWISPFRSYFKIVMANTNKEIVDLVVEACKTLGFKPYVYLNKNPLPCYRIVLSSWEDVYRFWKEIGFTIKRKVPPRFYEVCLLYEAKLYAYNKLRKELKNGKSAWKVWKELKKEGIYIPYKCLLNWVRGSKPSIKRVHNVKILKNGLQTLLQKENQRFE